MPLPAQTFATIADLLTYINTFIVPNANEEITAVEHNNVENALSNFIVQYTLNSASATIVNGGANVVLPAPITVFTAVPTSVYWGNDIQNEYYIVNATSFTLPIMTGFGYVDANLVVQTSFPARAAVHIAKVKNGMWIQVNNLSGGSGGSLPDQTGQEGRVLFSTGGVTFWGDQGLFIPAGDPNWVNSTTWVNGSSVVNPQFNSPHFFLFWNEFSRNLLQTTSPPEWQYVPGGFQVFEPGFDSATANVFLTFIGANT